MRGIAQALIATAHGRLSASERHAEQRLSDLIRYVIAVHNPTPDASFYRPALRDLAAKRYIAKCQRRTRLRNAAQYATGALIGIALIAAHHLIGA